MGANGDEAELLQAAVPACHMAKEQGRNRVIMTNQDDKELLARRRQMEWIRHAIKHNILYLDAQQIVFLAPKANSRIEVLVRMQGDNNEAINSVSLVSSLHLFI
jgi:predicted GTPase